MHGYINFVIRTRAIRRRSRASLRSIVRDTDKGASVAEIVPLARAGRGVGRRAALRDDRAGGVLALALVLASVGLYGVLSFGVAQRRRELGVRAALGARRGDLVGLVLREGLGLTILGVGSVSARPRDSRACCRGCSSASRPLDIVAFAAAPLVLLPIAIAACALPARRAAAADPAEALRCE